MVFAAKMLRYSFFALVAAVSITAQRPADTSICDYYTTALLKENTDANQLALLTLIVNTAVIGNCKLTVGSTLPYSPLITRC